MKLLLATGNQNKLREFRRMFPQNQILSPKEANVKLDVKETGKTFAENAAIKAKALYALTGIPTIADDSGIVADALNGFPGVYSARYANEDVCCEKLLRDMKGIPAKKRTARYVCAICFVLDNDHVYTVEGKCEGVVGFAEAGQNGFGYDPVFYVDGVSMAQMSDSEKDAISHRGAAFLKLQELFKELQLEI